MEERCEHNMYYLTILVYVVTLVTMGYQCSIADSFHKEKLLTDRINELRERRETQINERLSSKEHQKLMSIKNQLEEALEEELSKRDQ